MQGLRIKELRSLNKHYYYGEGESMEKPYTKKSTELSGNRYSNNLAYLNDYDFEFDFELSLMPKSLEKLISKFRYSNK